MKRCGCPMCIMASDGPPLTEFEHQLRLAIGQVIGFSLHREFK
jgi:hypothetical protein